MERKDSYVRSYLKEKYEENPDFEKLLSTASRKKAAKEFKRMYNDMLKISQEAQKLYHSLIEEAYPDYNITLFSTPYLDVEEGLGKYLEDYMREFKGTINNLDLASWYLYHYKD